MVLISTGNEVIILVGLVAVETIACFLGRNSWCETGAPMPRDDGKADRNRTILFSPVTHR